VSILVECSWKTFMLLANCLSLPEAVLTSIIITALYVGVLYLPVNAGERDDKRTVLSRIVSVGLVAVVGEAYVHLRLPTASATAAPPTAIPVFSSALEAVVAHAASAAAGVTLTLFFYAGHFAARTDPASASPREKLSLLDPATRHIAMRNFIAAPVIEELVFRRQALQLWGCVAPRAARIFGPAALFSLAHAHHARIEGISAVLLQLGYTLFFGAYASSLYIATGSVAAPIAAHVLCNSLELPDFAAITCHKHARAIVAFYIASLAALVYAFAPVTNWARSAVNHPRSAIAAVGISQVAVTLAPEILGQIAAAERRRSRLAFLAQLGAFAVLFAVYAFHRVTPRAYVALSP
jgi:Type II CAAX prenyl endopeptidase Rce1-like